MGLNADDDGADLPAAIAAGQNAVNMALLKKKRLRECADEDRRKRKLTQPKKSKVTIQGSVALEQTEHILAKMLTEDKNAIMDSSLLELVVDKLTKWHNKDRQKRGKAPQSGASAAYKTWLRKKELTSDNRAIERLYFIAIPAEAAAARLRERADCKEYLATSRMRAVVDLDPSDGEDVEVVGPTQAGKSGSTASV